MRETALLVLAAAVVVGCSEEINPLPENPADAPYMIVINPADFVSTNIVGNDFFPLTVQTFRFEGITEDNEAVIVKESYLSDTKVVMGVTCRVVHAQEWIEDELVEDTFDWYAQDLFGNVWYFGEETEEIEDGRVVSTEGSWEAGVNGALPGLIMPANPIPGMWYRQEYYEGEAEDVGQILKLGDTVTVPYGTFNDCLRTAEWNLLEPGIVENKYYARGVGLVKVEAVKGESGYENLVSIE